MYLTGLRGRGTSGMEPPNENVQCMGSQTFCRHIYKGFWTRSATSSLSATALEFFEGSWGMALFVFVFVFILVILERLDVGSWWMTVTFLLFSLPPCENRVLTSLRHDLIFFYQNCLEMVLTTCPSFEDGEGFSWVLFDKLLFVFSAPPGPSLTQPFLQRNPAPISIFVSFNCLQ